MANELNDKMKWRTVLENHVDQGITIYFSPSKTFAQDKFGNAWAFESIHGKATQNLLTALKIEWATIKEDNDEHCNHTTQTGNHLTW